MIGRTKSNGKQRMKQHHSTSRTPGSVQDKGDKRAEASVPPPEAYLDPERVLLHRLGVPCVDKDSVCSLLQGLCPLQRLLHREPVWVMDIIIIATTRCVHHEHTRLIWTLSYEMNGASDRNRTRPVCGWSTRLFPNSSCLVYIPSHGREIHATRCPCLLHLTRTGTTTAVSHCKSGDVQRGCLRSGLADFRGEGKDGRIPSTVRQK